MLPRVPEVGRHGRITLSDAQLLEVGIAKFHGCLDGGRLRQPRPIGRLNTIVIHVDAYEFVALTPRES